MERNSSVAPFARDDKIVTVQNEKLHGKWSGAHRRGARSARYERCEK
jgi:hypothetical protein